MPSFAIANPARFRSSYQQARALLHDGRVSQVFLITAEGHIGAIDRPAWHADPKLAGGGVLLHDCYPLVDQILWNFPIPQQVYALITNQAPDKQQRLYLTEETAVVSLKFAEALMANLVATRRHDLAGNETTLTIYGKDAVLTVTDDQVTLSTGCEHNDQVWRYDETSQDVLERVLSSFSASVRAPDEHPLFSSGAANLANMAVFESAYLSARTGFPEEPTRILRIAGGPTGTATSI